MRNIVTNLSKIKIVPMFVILSILYSLQIFGQWNFQLATNQEYSSNPFRSVNPYSDFISTFNVGIEREFEDFNILYFGSYSKFKESSDIDYYWHQLGFYQETESVIWGAYFEQRFNKDLNNYFNYLNYAAYAKKQFQLLNINWEANLSLNSMNYSEIPDFNNWIASTGLLGRKSFETKTTLIGTVILNYKGFKNFNANIDSVSGTEFIYYNSENVNISQLVLNGRLAQSIIENTGLALNFNYKTILSGSGFSASLIQSTYGDTELYDDPISQEGYSYGGTLTQILPLDISLKLNYTYLDKNYPSQGIYLSETEYQVYVARQDKQSIFSASISKPIYFDNGNELNLNLNYYLITNKSNSYNFNYDINTLSLSLNYIF
ncbi:MAG: hypothetical protein KKF62_00640 [Bacteroidetes bacterium]|nr:hypothetical protein [Bacteroidota bacterium]MBU1114629.1 hypothetical protein [Bacteroidota bacterium]MBU1797801.1 hypothetical protein [Bacteroidota bacterium]